MTAVAVLALLLVSAPAADGEVVERRLGCMGTELRVEVEAETRAVALAASEAAVRALEAAEARLSTWIPDSETSRLNATPVGEAFEMSPELAAELAGALHWWRETGGAFDPGLGELVRVWGLRDGGRLPEDGEVERALAARGAEALEVDGRVARRRHAGLVVEEGAFGKGAGLARALEALAAAGARRATLDLGGQVAVFGSGPPQGLGIVHPDDRGRVVLRLAVTDGSLATSGNSERGIVVAGERRSHLIDPRTGRPAPDFGSLTVWSADPLAADCLSTGLYVLGPDDAMSWASARDGVEAVALVRAGNRVVARATPGLSRRLLVVDPEVELRFEPPIPPTAPDRTTEDS